MRWDVKGEYTLLWMDISSLALGVTLNVNGNIIHNAWWLRQDKCSYINLAELDTVVEGLNFAIAWEMKNITHN